MLVQMLETTDPPTGLTCKAFEEWSFDSGIDSIRVQFLGDDGEFGPSSSLVPIKKLVPEDRWRLSRSRKCQHFGCPRKVGSPLAVCTVVGKNTFCSSDELRIPAKQAPNQYKKGKSTLNFMFLGSYVPKRNLGTPTWHVSTLSFVFILRVLFTFHSQFFFWIGNAVLLWEMLSFCPACTRLRRPASTPSSHRQNIRWFNLPTTRKPRVRLQSM